MRARALMYHDVVTGQDWDTSGFPGPWSGHYKFTAAEFDRHLDAIKAAWKGAPPKAGTPEEAELALRITFDDGGIGSLLAAEALERRGWRGYFFVTTGRIGSNGFLDAAGIRALVAAGHSIGSHSETHPTRMADLDAAQLRLEWKRSTDTLAQILGQPVRVASVPGGYYAEKVARAAGDEGIGWLFTSEPVERTGRIGDCRILGRYAIHRGHSPAHAAGYAAGEPWLCVRTRVWWDSKKLFKRVAGRAYLSMAGALRRSAR